MKLIKQFEIVEVGPRDGFQSIKKFIPFKLKMEIILLLINSGIKNIQIGSFVSPKAIIQMKDSYKIVKNIKSKNFKNLKLGVLVPNLYGAKIARELELEYVTFVFSVSEKHNLANVKRTIQESLLDLKNIIKIYKNEEKITKIKVDLATTFGCPFEGVQSISKVLELVKKVVSFGVKNVVFCDTIGVANPLQVEKFWNIFLKKAPEGINYGVHFHDTRGLGLANILISLQYPIKWVESSFGGFGGCPFAPGAAGNVATEDLLNMLEAAGVLNIKVNNKLLLEAVEKLLPYNREALNSHFYNIHKKDLK